MGTKQEVTVHFDHHRDANEVDPDEAYAELRSRCPFAWSDQQGGFWVTTRYADASEVSKSYKRFDSRDGFGIPSLFEERINPSELDPPEHTRYRRVLNPLLTPEAVATVKPTMEKWTDYYLDRIIEAGECDLVYDIALAIPAAVTLDWLGWDDQDESIRIGIAWHHAFGMPIGDKLHQQAQDDLVWLQGRIAEQLEERAANPRDDVMTILLNHEFATGPISQQGAAELVHVLIAGGVDTTTSLIGQTFVYLYEHPEQRAYLREHPEEENRELWDSVTDEFLRRFAPIRATGRTVRGDHEFRGFELKDGERILSSLCAANLDPEVFPDPETVDFNRDASGHLTFGKGIHKCAGQHFARAEFRTVVSRTLARLGEYDVDLSRSKVYERQSETSGWATVPATFVPGERVQQQEVVRADG